MVHCQALLMWPARSCDDNGTVNQQKCTAFDCRCPYLAFSRGSQAKWTGVLYSCLACCSMAGKATAGSSCQACHQQSRG